jgi:hypothetical protein
VKISRADVLRFRVQAQELDAGRDREDAAILDLGVQDTGPDGAAWALALRRCTAPAEDLLLAWTLRGAPHAYRRSEAAAVAAATAPLSEADAAKRVFDASRPLKKAGIPVLDALDHIAEEMRDIAARPVVKGQMSGELSRRLDEPYLRYCRSCEAIHTYEQPFRLSALQAGLELEAGTSPPVLRRIKGWRGPAKAVPGHLDPIRGVLRFLGPADPKLVAGYLDAPVRDVANHWPDDVETVDVEGRDLQILAADAAALREAEAVDGVRLLGPFDLFLQGRDRELLVPAEPARKDLWRTLGRPGGILDGHELVGTWRPKASGKKLRLAVTMWSGGAAPKGIDEQAARLAAFRGVEFDGYVA